MVAVRKKTGGVIILSILFSFVNGIGFTAPLPPSTRVSFDIIEGGEPRGTLNISILEWSGKKKVIESWCENTRNEYLPFFPGNAKDGNPLHKQVVFEDGRANMESMALFSINNIQKRLIYEIRDEPGKNKTIIQKIYGKSAMSPIPIEEKVKILTMENILLMFLIDGGAIMKNQLFWLENKRQKRMVVQNEGSEKVRAGSRSATARKYGIYHSSAATDKKTPMFKFFVSKEGYPLKLQTNSGKWGLDLNAIGRTKTARVDLDNFASRLRSDELQAYLHKKKKLIPGKAEQNLKITYSGINGNHMFFEKTSSTLITNEIIRSETAKLLLSKLYGGNNTSRFQNKHLKEIIKDLPKKLLNGAGLQAGYEETRKKALNAQKESIVEDPATGQKWTAAPGAKQMSYVQNDLTKNMKNKHLYTPDEMQRFLPNLFSPAPANKTRYYVVKKNKIVNKDRILVTKYVPLNDGPEAYKRQALWDLRRRYQSSVPKEWLEYRFDDSVKNIQYTPHEKMYRISVSKDQILSSVLWTCGKQPGTCKPVSEGLYCSNKAMQVSLTAREMLALYARKKGISLKPDQAILTNFPQTGIVHIEYIEPLIAQEKLWRN